MAEILWHHRETRWQQRIQTSACSIGSPQSTRKLVTSGSVGGMASNGCLYPEVATRLLFIGRNGAITKLNSRIQV